MNNLVRRPLYLCNPDLAKENCSQTSCHLNGGQCELTTNPEYAVHVATAFTKDGPIDIPLCVMSLEDINDGIKNGTLLKDIDRAVTVAKIIVKELH